MLPSPVVAAAAQKLKSIQRAQTNSHYHHHLLVNI